MTLLPPSSNASYRGAPASAAFLALLAVTTIVPGAIHFFLPDGGAGVIAGLDLSVNGAVIVGVFAWMGATQIAYGFAQLAVALRYRALTPLMLLLALIEKGLAALAGWVTKTSPSGHHPPEHYGALIAVPLIAVFLVFALREPKPRSA